MRIVSRQIGRKKCGKLKFPVSPSFCPFSNFFYIFFLFLTFVTKEKFERLAWSINLWLYLSSSPTKNKRYESQYEPSAVNFCFSIAARSHPVEIETGFLWIWWMIYYHWGIFFGVLNTGSRQRLMCMWTLLSEGKRLEEKTKTNPFVSPSIFIFFFGVIRYIFGWAAVVTQAQQMSASLVSNNSYLINHNVNHVLPLDPGNFQPAFPPSAYMSHLPTVCLDR